MKILNRLMIIAENNDEELGDDLFGKYFTYAKCIGGDSYWRLK